MQFSKRNRHELKQYFKKTLIPTEQQFEHLINGSLNTADDGVIREEPNKPLSIQSDGVDATKNVLALYDKLTDDVPHWTLGLQHIGSPGLAISDRGGTNRLFIASGSGDPAEWGNVGIGTAAPKAKLHVNGSARIDGDLTLTGELKKAIEWKPLTLAPKFTAGAPPTHPNPSYCKDASGFVHIRGFINSNGTYGDNALIATIDDADYRPEFKMIFSAIHQGLGNARLDITPDGAIRLCALESGVGKLGPDSHITLNIVYQAKPPSP